MYNTKTQGNDHKVAGTQREADEIIAQSYWPEDITNALDNGDMWLEDAKESISYELSCLFADISDALEGNYSNGSEVAKQGLELVQEFLDIAGERGIDVGRWAHDWYTEDMAKLHRIAC